MFVEGVVCCTYCINPLYLRYVSGRLVILHPLKQGPHQGFCLLEIIICAIRAISEVHRDLDEGFSKSDVGF